MQDYVEFESPIIYGPGPCTEYAALYMKIYHDGAHHVGTLLLPSHKRTSWRTKHNSDADRLYRDFYRASMQAQKECKTRYQLDTARLQAKADALRSLEKTFPEDKEAIREKIDDMHERMKASIAARKKRFRRKAFLNEWSYFVTVTYDSTLYASEDEFRRSVDKLFSNLHTRNGWRYMGVWEQGELNERLHFHCLLYVPEGELIGAIYNRSDYAHKTHGIRVTHCNTFFERRFGRNDFEPLMREELNNSISYILKYLEKSGERIRYSRGIPSDVCIPVRSVDVVDQYTDFVPKFILFDDVVGQSDVYKAKPSDVKAARAQVQHKYYFDILASRTPVIGKTYYVDPVKLLA